MNKSRVSGYFPKTKKTSKQETTPNKNTKRRGKGSVDKRAAVAPAQKNPEQDEQMQYIEQLSHFDADPTYGPCAGIPRMMRWENAHRLGLEPPQEIPYLVEKTGSTKSYLD
jgi:hypothetical protein